MACEICDSTGFVIVENCNGISGAKPCPRCKSARVEAGSRTPITDEALEGAVKSLESLAYFPREVRAQTMVGDALAAMCPSLEALRYVARRAVGLYKTWDECGVPGLRQILCSRYVPADGEVMVCTHAFPDGVPPERIEPRSDRVIDPGAMPLALPSGRAVSADSKMAKAINDLAEKKQFPAPPKKPQRRPQRDSQFRHRLEQATTPPHMRPDAEIDEEQK